MRQISIFVENRRGSLCDITEILERENIDIRALSIAETTDFGILRIIVADPERTLRILKDNDITASITPVIAVKMNDRPGGLHAVLAVLRDASVSVEYAYAFLGRKQQCAYVILRVDDNETAKRTLMEKGVPVADSAEVFEN